VGEPGAVNVQTPCRALENESSQNIVQDIFVDRFVARCALKEGDER
jgi:hypothetical protein